MFLTDDILAYKPVFLNLERNVERETETFSVPPLYTCKLFVYSWLPISPHPAPSLSDIPLRATRNAITDWASSVVDSFCNFYSLWARKGNNSNHFVYSSPDLLKNVVREYRESHQSTRLKIWGSAFHPQQSSLSLLLCYRRLDWWFGTHLKLLGPT